MLQNQFTVPLLGGGWEDFSKMVLDVCLCNCWLSTRLCKSKLSLASRNEATNLASYHFYWLLDCMGQSETWQYWQQLFGDRWWNRFLNIQKNTFLARLEVVQIQWTWCSVWGWLMHPHWWDCLDSWAIPMWSMAGHQSVSSCIDSRIGRGWKGGSRPWIQRQTPACQWSKHISYLPRKATEIIGAVAAWDNQQEVQTMGLLASDFPSPCLKAWTCLQGCSCDYPTCPWKWWASLWCGIQWTWPFWINVINKVEYKKQNNVWGQKMKGCR